MSARKPLCIVPLCKVVQQAPAVSRRLVGGRQPSDEKALDEPPNVVTRRPRRATAVAAALRIQGKLERAGIVHDRKAYMQTLSSAVTIAQTEEQQQFSRRKNHLKRHAHDYFEGIRDVEAASQPRTGTNDRATEDAYETVDTYRISVPPASSPGADCFLHAGGTSLVAQAAPTDARQKKARSPGHRPQGVKKKLCPGYRRQYSNVRTLANPPPQPGAKLIPARRRPVTAVASPEHGNSDLPAVQRSDWTDVEVQRLLHICTQKVRPDTANFWVKVAKKMPGQNPNVHVHLSSCKTLYAAVSHAPLLPNTSCECVCMYACLAVLWFRGTSEWLH